MTVRAELSTALRSGLWRDAVLFAALLSIPLACHVAARRYPATSRKRPLPGTDNLCGSYVAKSGKIKICVATRIHNQNAEKPPDLDRVRQFLREALKYAELVAIAVGDNPSSTSDSGESLSSQIHKIARELEWELGREPGCLAVIPVQPWGQFTPALNALLGLAAAEQCDCILYQSLETSVDKGVLEVLLQQMDPGDLVLGGALPGHDFRPGARELNGVTSPWNTLALWSVPQLAKIGFLAVADGQLEGVPGGIEEVTAIALLQHMARTTGQPIPAAKLLQIPQIEWQTSWQDLGRQEWHRRKMESKLSRAQTQMDALGIPPGTVLHVEVP